MFVAKYSKYVLGVHDTGSQPDLMQLDDGETCYYGGPVSLFR